MNKTYFCVSVPCLRQTLTKDRARERSYGLVTCLVASAITASVSTRSVCRATRSDAMGKHSAKMGMCSDKNSLGYSKATLKIGAGLG